MSFGALKRSLPFLASFSSGALVCCGLASFTFGEAALGACFASAGLAAISHAAWSLRDENAPLAWLWQESLD